MALFLSYDSILTSKVSSYPSDIWDIWHLAVTSADVITAVNQNAPAQIFLFYMLHSFIVCGDFLFDHQLFIYQLLDI